MKTNEITMNPATQIPAIVPPPAPVVTAPPAAAPAGPVVEMAMVQLAPVNPVAAKPRKGGRKNKTPALTTKP